MIVIQILMRQSLQTIFQFLYFFRKFDSQGFMDQYLISLNGITSVGKTGHKFLCPPIESGKFFIIQVKTLIIFATKTQILQMTQNPETNRQLDSPDINRSSDSFSQETQEYDLPLFAVFRFAETNDYIFMAFGSLGALGAGAGLPAFAFVWGETINSFDPSTPSDLTQQTKDDMLLFIFVGLGIMVAGFLMYAFWTFSGERQGIKCRKMYVKALLSQQIGWYDLQNQSELASKFGRDTLAFQDGISTKVAVMIFVFSSLISGFLFAFITGWTLALVIVTMLPAIGIVGGIANQIIISKDRVEKQAYSKASGRASQALMGIKTVKSLVGEQFESDFYRNSLQENQARLRKFGFMIGGSWGLVNAIIFLFYALGFWFGMQCIILSSHCPQATIGEAYTVGDVLTVVFGIMIAGFNFSQLGPALEKIVEGREAAKRIFSVIDRVPEIRNTINPIKLDRIQEIEFKNVYFAYPKSKSTNVLNNLSLKFNQNSIGLAGESGCGKSTIMQLLMRFYDPDRGNILINGHDLRDLDLNWLRDQFGYVGQQPVLFATSIRQNILMAKQDASDEEIETALKKAEALRFVNRLQKKLETYAGTGGNQLSGGQKQRIAISRALLKKPRVLLLDQATSALDRRNEKSIQQTLNLLSRGQITISIAHRNKTLMNSDIVYVIDQGEVKQKGRFFQLQRFKNIAQEEDEEDYSLDKSEILKSVGEADKTKLLVENKQEKEIEIIQRYKGSKYRRIFSYSSDKKPVFIFALIFAAANGIIFPIQSLLLGDVLFALVVLTTNPSDENSRKIVEDDSLLYVLVAACCFLFATMQSGLFSWISLSITRRIRCQTYEKILHLPMAWFDRPNNTAGTLTTFLSADCSQIQSLITGAVSVITQNISTIITALIIGFIFEWRTTLVTLAIMPLIAAAGGISLIFQTGLDDKSSLAYNESSNLLMEFIMNMRTVTSFNLQNYFNKKYQQLLIQPEKLLYKKGAIVGSAFGVGQFVFYASFGVLFYLGSLFVDANQDVSTTQMFKALFALMFAGLGIGNSILFLPDLGSAKVAASNIFRILDLKTENELRKEAGSKLICKKIEGKIKIKKIDFKYETRNEYVFENFSIKFKSGQKIGLVGKSGCGKSTILQLILGFYEIQNGKITIDGINIHDYDVRCLRRELGYVGQQPMLFDTSFRENIRYNWLATEHQIRKAARDVNAYDFIMNNHLDFEPRVRKNKNGKKKSFLRKIYERKEDTPAIQYDFSRSVGIGGSHISGGQKQRIAIARAIIREPKILLLDEATSALDSQNQVNVQKSLDQIMEGRGIFSVAHRLQTIKNSNDIIVFDKGKVVEQGKYQELLRLGGYFYKLERGIQFV